MHWETSKLLQTSRIQEPENHLAWLSKWGFWEMINPHVLVDRIITCILFKIKKPYVEHFYGGKGWWRRFPTVCLILSFYTILPYIFSKCRFAVSLIYLILNCSFTIWKHCKFGTIPRDKNFQLFIRNKVIQANLQLETKLAINIWVNA